MGLYRDLENSDFSSYKSWVWDLEKFRASPWGLGLRSISSFSIGTEELGLAPLWVSMGTQKNSELFPCI